ncbi:MAG: hypothetical protein WBP45_01615 [Daejeonella sp.]
MNTRLKERVTDLVKEFYNDNFEEPLKNLDINPEEVESDMSTFEFFYMDLEELVDSGEFPKGLGSINNIIDYLTEHTNEELLKTAEDELLQYTQTENNDWGYSKDINLGSEIEQDLRSLNSVTTELKTGTRPALIILTLFVLGLMANSGWLYFQHKPSTNFYDSPFILIFGAFTLLFISVAFRRSYIEFYMDTKKLIIKNRSTGNETVYPMTDIKGYYESSVLRKNRPNLGVLILELKSGKKIYIHESRYNNYPDIHLFISFHSRLPYLGEKFFYWW